jgi:L-asparaginase
MIEIITTGGTFDKVYQPEMGKLGFDGESYVLDILKTARTRINFIHSPLMAIDSLEMNQNHRQCLLQHISNSSHSQIVITHGTDTMPQTADFLRKQNLGKTLVLCGAMRPHSLGQSDASFNLGFALGAVSLLTPGVYVAMNCKIFEEGVQKNKSIGIFED